VNSAGAKYGELRYKAFGETRYTFGTTPTSFAFTGQRQESGLGLYFYNARWYDPALGRFIQADTVVPNPINPQSLNRFSYGYNNPVKYVDPTGHCAVTNGVFDNVLDCNEQDFRDMTWENRANWTKQFQAKTGVEQFDNIVGVIDYFADDPVFQNSEWAKVSDAGVLLVIENGYRLSIGDDSLCSTADLAGVCEDASEKWEAYFDAFANKSPDASSLWGTAEQAGVDYGTAVAEPLREIATTEELFWIDTFVAVGNVYRRLVEKGVNVNGVTTPSNSGTFTYWASQAVSALSTGFYGNYRYQTGPYLMMQGQ
jgi:RHS repeat-associated protein